MTDGSVTDLADSLKSLVDQLSQEVAALQEEAQIVASAHDMVRLQEIRDRLGAIQKECEAKLKELMLVLEERVEAARGSK